MLERLGGRSAWAGLKNTINSSQQNRAGEPTVVYTVITTRTAQVSRSDGTWRAAVQVLDVNVPFHDSSFARPE